MVMLVATKYVTDARYHLDALSQAIAAGRIAIFLDYVAWAKVVLCSRGIPVQVFEDTLEACRHTLEEDLPRNQAAIADQYLLDSLNCLPTLPTTTPSYFNPDRPLAELARRYLDALLKADRREASQMVLDAVHQGTPVRDIYLHVFQRSQYEIGRLWQSNQISVAQEHLCTAATQLIMSQLYPFIFETERKNRRIVAACVGGDLHEIGIRMVADFFEMDGWDTFYLGADVPSASIVQTVIDRSAHVLAVSDDATDSHRFGRRIDQRSTSESCLCGDDQSLWAAIRLMWQPICGARLGQMDTRSTPYGPSNSPSSSCWRRRYL